MLLEFYNDSDNLELQYVAFYEILHLNIDYKR